MGAQRAYLDSSLNTGSLVLGLPEHGPGDQAASGLPARRWDQRRRRWRRHHTGRGTSSAGRVLQVSRTEASKGETTETTTHSSMSLILSTSLGFLRDAKLTCSCLARRRLVMSGGTPTSIRWPRSPKFGAVGEWPSAPSGKPRAWC